MLIASVAGSAAGLAIGGRLGPGEAVAGTVLGFLAAASLAFGLNAVLMQLSRASGRDPGEIQNALAAMATWATAGLAVLLLAGAVLRVY